MTVEIGSKYRENLESLRNHIVAFRNGAMFEETEVVISKGSRRCYYDKCQMKPIRADRILIIVEEDRTEFYPFHSNCIDALLNDFRFLSD